MLLITAEILLSDVDAKLRRSRALVARSQERIARTEILMDMSQSAINLSSHRPTRFAQLNYLYH